MPNHMDIYKQEADKYDLLISKQPDLLAALQSICRLDGKDVIDLGAGTGRLALPIAGVAKSVLALDASEAMLQVAASKLIGRHLDNWTAKVSDHLAIEAEPQSADVLVSGWSLSYVCNSSVEAWELNLAKVIDEIKRVLRPGGTAIIIETLGTGVQIPKAPDFLRDYYAILETEYEFKHSWIRTDYQFDNWLQAEELIRFFFGDSLADQVVSEKLATLPECAGLWWRAF